MSNINEMLPGEIESYKWSATVFKALYAQKDQAALVVTGHLYVEHWLEWLIRVSVSKPEKLFKSIHLTFAGKLAVAESMDLLGDDLAKATHTLNTIRNRIVHNFEYQIPQKDLKLLASPATNIPNEYQALISEMGSPKTELIMFCVSFTGYVVGVVAGRRDARRRKL